MGDVSSDHSQTSRDGVVEESISPGREPIPAKSQYDPLENPSPVLTQTIESPGLSRQAPRRSDEYRSAPGSQRTIPTTLNMADMASILPSYQGSTRSFSQQNVQQQFIPAHQSQGIMYPVHQMPFMNPNAPGGTIYNMPYSPSYQIPYMQQHPQLQGGFSSYPAAHHHQTPMHTQSSAYNTPYYTQHQYNPGYSEMNAAVSNSRMEGQTGRSSTEYRRAPQVAQTSNAREAEKRRHPANYDVSQTIVDGSSRMKQTQASLTASEKGAARLPLVTTSNTPPRGPPRKPKQSGHALWVGNLPPSTNVVDLKDHFSKDATSDIESVFLISKSNCAFVNYKSEAACAAAVARFHDSRFQGVRLVCRLRRGASATSTGQSNPQSARRGDEGMARSPEEVKEKKIVVEESHVGQIRPSRVPERFFIVKSLTLEDLELSRRSGIWATQTHNEAALNQAYESADNVYLIFSANKSGEYFGYARMVSAITDDEALALEAPPRPENPSVEGDNLEVIPTEATATAPKGRIIDDSARGTIFWEADSSEDDGNSNEDEDTDVEDPDNDDDNNNDDEHVVEDGITKDEKGTAEGGGEDVESSGQTFGKPFRIEWMSTERLPFYRTRGLRNPWNSNREVKIARDGTEIEPSVGRKLTQLFHAHPNVVSSGGQHGSGFQRSY